MPTWARKPTPDTTAGYLSYMTPIKAKRGLRYKIRLLIVRDTKGGPKESYDKRRATYCTWHQRSPKRGLQYSSRLLTVRDTKVWHIDCSISNGGFSDVLKKRLDRTGIMSLQWQADGLMKWCLMSSDVSWHIRDKLWPMPKHGSINLRPRKPEGSLGRTAQDVHLISHSSWTMTDGLQQRRV